MTVRSADAQRPKVVLRRVAWTMVFLLIGAGYFFPSLVFLATASGWNVTGEQAVLGHRLVTTNGWYPFASSESFIGKYLLGEHERGSVLYLRHSWLTPWAGEQALVTRESASESRSIPQEELEVLSFKWGDALIYRPLGAGAGGRTFGYIPAFDLSISTTSRNFVSAIQNVR